MAKYTITGKDKAGKRFVIDTDTPQHYNIWSGTLWKNVDEDKNPDKHKRVRIKNY